jgi:hypothetical protein
MKTQNAVTICGLLYNVKLPEEITSVNTLSKVPRNTYRSIILKWSFKLCALMTAAGCCGNDNALRKVAARGGDFLSR